VRHAGNAALQAGRHPLSESGHELRDFPSTFTAMVAQQGFQPERVIHDAPAMVHQDDSQFLLSQVRHWSACFRGALLVVVLSGTASAPTNYDRCHASFSVEITDEAEK
jgi:hypothetical protein